jgi:hypothetical protein
MTDAEKIQLLILIAKIEIYREIDLVNSDQDCITNFLIEHLINSKYSQCLDNLLLYVNIKKELAIAINKQAQLE